MYVYIYRERETERQTETDRDRESFSLRMIHESQTFENIFEKLQNVQPNVAIVSMKQHYTKKNKYSKRETFIGTAGYFTINWIDIIA